MIVTFFALPCPNSALLEQKLINIRMIRRALLESCHFKYP